MNARSIDDGIFQALNDQEAKAQRLDTRRLVGEMPSC